jgi:hypothetical protein
MYVPDMKGTLYDTLAMLASTRNMKKCSGLEVCILMVSVFINHYDTMVQPKI